MIFHSLDFLVFFVVTLATYWWLPLRGQNLLLLAASYVFYGWIHPWFLTLIFATTFIDYWSARRMTERPEHRKAWLWLSIVTNFGMLGFFKYSDLILESLEWLSGRPMPRLGLTLPIGISFFSFQTLSYSIDIYRRQANRAMDAIHEHADQRARV